MALEIMKAAMGRENGEKGPNAKMGEMPGNKGTGDMMAMAEKMSMPKEDIENIKSSKGNSKGGNPDMSAMMKAMMGRRPRNIPKKR